MANLTQIQEYLQHKKLPYKTVKLTEKVYKVSDVVKSGIDLACVVKTLVVRTNDGFIALALRGNDRVDFKKVRVKFGSKSELAKPDEVLEVVGVPIGAVCPILLEVPIYIDKKVMSLKNVHMGSGDLEYGLEMSLHNLLGAVSKYEVFGFAL